VEFNKLMEELDARAIQRIPKIPRYDRFLGPMVVVTAPTKAKEWILAGNKNSDVNSPDLI